MTSNLVEFGIFGKTRTFYEDKVFSRVKNIRGSTRLLHKIEELGIKGITSEDKDGNYLVDCIEKNIWFRSRKDVKYFFWETEYVNRFLKKTKRTEVFCDVGGYHGFYGLVSNSEKSIVFEADPENAGYIRQNLGLNPDRDVEIVEKAVWSSNDSLQFEAEGSGTSHVSDQGIERAAVTLDNFFEDKKDPDTIKIDVEGAEGHVIKGAEEVLERSHPTIFMEIHLEGRTDKFGFSKDNLISILESHDYSIVFSENRGSEKLVIAE